MQLMLYSIGLKSLHPPPHVPHPPPHRGRARDPGPESHGVGGRGYLRPVDYSIDCMINNVIKINEQYTLHHAGTHTVTMDSEFVCQKTTGSPLLP